MKLGWYELCRKYKALDWIDDHIIWYIWDKPIDIYKTIKNWFYCNWNKEHYRLIKTAFTSYPWDYCYMYYLMEAQFDKQIKWFEKHKVVEDSDEQILRPIKWARHCAHTLCNDHELYEYDIKTHIKTYVGPKVNYRNRERYVKLARSQFRETPSKEELFEYWEKYPEEYYQLKCQYLLHKIMFYYETGWWD